jgi:hypothetical protein
MAVIGPDLDRALSGRGTILLDASHTATSMWPRSMRDDVIVNQILWNQAA